MDSDLGDTIIALEGGLVNNNLQDALRDVEGWRARLENAGFPHAAELRQDLSELALRLSRGDVHDIGELLARLGQWTHATVNHAPAQYREDLQRLGDVLHLAATQAI
ncbi:hypothetical protein [Deinococcus peraridilitoris]|uniref:Uncharacterized protein n=1 Tax=Deinococcus peraridilitoris (strain DSM 19664 / LMG 22246 / CIP 109416 / KR-200) TaxID=937777 RepID=L0A1J1_DEIPD|nr:hypothetical protein [Deinococcus peraridilitoris]AFZ66880.1 hypothetical protein Deipe_1331 [Deinococcus peraridilitoris DSM 19664]